MADKDQITTTSNIVDRSRTQETAQQVRAREAREDAAHRQSQVTHEPKEPPKVDVGKCLANIEEMLDRIGEEALHLQSGDELVAFLNHITFAKVDLHRLAQMERDKALAVQAVDDKED